MRAPSQQVKRKAAACETFRQDALRAQQALEESQKKLRQASALILSFAHTHPEWKPPPLTPLLPKDHAMASDLFTRVDKDLDVEAQMKLDPSGTCTTDCLCLSMLCVCVCMCMCVC